MKARNQKTMNKKKSKWSGLKEGIILYLAISKIFYWMNLVGEMAQADFEGAWPFIIDRVLNQDLPIILVITALIIIDRLKGNLYVKLVIGYVAYIAIIFVYNIVINWIFGDGPMEGIRSFGNLFLIVTAQFIIISIILSFKERLMKTVKDEPEE